MSVCVRVCVCVRTCICVYVCMCAHMCCMFLFAIHTLHIRHILDYQLVLLVYRIIKSYLIREESGVLTTPRMDEDKVRYLYYLPSVD